MSDIDIVQFYKDMTRKSILKEEDGFFMYKISGRCPRCTKTQKKEIIEVYIQDSYLCDGHGNPKEQIDEQVTSHICPECSGVIYSTYARLPYSGVKPDGVIKVSKCTVDIKLP